MIIISIENAAANGQAITIVRANGEGADDHQIRPGESTRIAITGPAQLSLSQPTAPLPEPKPEH